MCSGRLGLGRVSVLCVLAVSWLALRPTLAQENTPESAGGIEATHDEIRSVRDGLLAAIEAKDTEGVLSLMRPDVTITAQDGTELKTLVGHEQVRDYMERLLTGEDPGVASLEIDLTVDALTTLYGEDTGVAYGSSNDHYVLSGGGEFDLPTRWSATLVKQDGWQLASLHVSSNLFDNPVLDVAKNSLYYVGLIAAVVGFVLGFLFCKLLGTKAAST